LLRFADLTLDEDMVAAARQAAHRLLTEHPEAAERHVARWLGVRSEYLKA
jgi:ATP-dependent DNA helicase RecG